jgi:hypothetical protein
MFAIRVPSGIGHTQRPREASPDRPKDESLLSGLDGSGKPTLMCTIPTLPTPGARSVDVHDTASLCDGVAARDVSACLPHKADERAMACARPS